MSGRVVAPVSPERLHTILEDGLWIHILLAGSKKIMDAFVVPVTSWLEIRGMPFEGGILGIRCLVSVDLAMGLVVGCIGAVGCNVMVWSGGMR